MNAIVAVNNKWGIGKNGKLLYHIPEDMAFFKKMTKEKVVIMGRKTLESLPGGKPLPDRTNIVLSSTMQPTDGLILCRDMAQLDNAVANYDTDDIFVIGGGEVYKALLPACKKAFVTRVIDYKESDTKFPNLDKDPGWELVYSSELREHNGIRYCFSTYENIASI